ncbi:histidinol dehydrogenase [Clostridia bacterium OttesenSCG-928-O13]|nr:histidinol dehydrogenase [Clostridia bacterium OttesenSCG-928-O13]
MFYLKKARERTVATNRELAAGVEAIIDDVRQNGDAALLRYNKQFDDCERPGLRISQGEIDEAYGVVPPKDVADIKAAAENIRAFARAQRDTLAELPRFSPVPGLVLGHRVLPIEACCCYVPGGGYPLYSTALMLGIPAKIAGVKRVAATSPTMKGKGKIHPKTLVALDVAGVDEIYAVGGAQAIAAFSYGTGQIAPVDLIVGPGNSYVTEAKRQCFGQVGIDFLAGPSEVLVIADESADAAVIAIDLLAQSEHDRQAQGIVVTTSQALGKEILAQVEAQLQNLETAGIARDAWESFGEVAVVESMEEAIAYSNQRAPEHLELQVADSDAIVPRLHNYGSLFVGQYTAEVFGDYASGTNHTLPTLRAARYTGGVWVGTFLKTCTHQSCDVGAMQALAPLVRRMAEGEGLAAHARAAGLRLEKWKQE